MRNVKAYKNDDHIEERLLHIRGLIYCNYMHRLYSLHNLIDRMISGYDKRFGYDQNQLENVLKVWYKFSRGESLGANADAEAVTLADELAACYAFMQGLRDNTGFLGGVAMGIMTAGYSEYVFTTMTLAEDMREAVFNSNGDEFGYWDAVIMGVKEFEMNIIMDIAMTKGGGKAFEMLRESSIKNFHYDIIAIPQGITKAYQSGIKADYEQLAKEVWTDKNALRQLQALDDPYAINMRAEFNRYRAQRYARIQEDALDRVAKATGRPREELYIMNACALRVGAPKNGLSPIEFEVILRERFGVTLEQFTEEMAACLV